MKLQSYNRQRQFYLSPNPPPPPKKKRGENTALIQVCLYLKSDGLAREGLHKNLHPGT